MKKFLVSILMLSLTVLVFTEDQVAILCYHTFINNCSGPYNFSTDEFKRHIQELKNLGYCFVSWEQILSNQVKGNSNILITIDDGNRTIKNIYENVLKENNIKPILFIYPNIIGKVFYALKYDELHNFYQQGFTIGAHGYYHLYLTHKFFVENPDGFKKEIFLSKCKLEKRLSTEINVFGYPFGIHPPIAEEYVKKAGYKYAFTVDQGFVKIPLELNSNPYSLPRFLVTHYSWKKILNILKNHIKSPIQAFKRGKYENC